MTAAKLDAVIDQPAPYSGASVSLLTWARVVVRWRKLVAVTALAFAALGCAIALLLPNRYTATVVLLPPQQGQSEGAAFLSQLSSLGGIAAGAEALGIKNPNDQQVALLKSRIVEDAMVAQFHLERLYHQKYVSTARKKWEKMTRADSGLKDGLIRVSVTDSDPQRAATMANAWVQEYRTFSSTLAVSESSQRRLFYQEQLDDAHQALLRAEADMAQTEQRTGVIDLAGQARGMIESAGVLRGQLAARQIEIKAMRDFAGPDNPDLKRAEDEATGLEAQLAAMDANADRKSGDLIAPPGKVTQAALDYERALREVKYRETLQDLLMRQYEGARVDEAREGPLIQVVEAAIPPDRPSPYRKWVALFAILFALPIAVLSAVAAEAVSLLLRARHSAPSWMTALETLLEK